MSVRAYPAYRDSGVEWVGRVPAHWLVQRLKVSTRSCQNGIWGDEPVGDESDIICIRVADFDRITFSVRLDDPTIRNVSARDRESRQIRHGDLLIEKSGGGERQPVGAVVLFNHKVPAVCSNFVARIELSEGMDASYWRYVHAAAYAVRLNYRSIKQTSGIQNLDHSSYLNELAPFPPLIEQCAIASFLDRETGKIDALVAEQERLIALLHEKRQAIITQLVTKGLNPDVPMTDSGVEWLGKLPTHWKVTRLRFLCVIETGSADTADAVEEGAFPFFVRSPIIERIDRHTHDCEAVFTAGDGAGVGKIYHHFKGKFTAHQRVYIFKDFKEISASFFYHYVSSLFYRVVLEGTAKSTVDSLRRPMLADFFVTVPPLVEQQEILESIAVHDRSFSVLAEETARAVALLRERRAALISAAVTGKVDVRDLAAQPEAQVA